MQKVNSLPSGSLQALTTLSVEHKMALVSESLGLGLASAHRLDNAALDTILKSLCLYEEVKANYADKTHLLNDRLHTAASLDNWVDSLAGPAREDSFRVYLTHDVDWINTLEPYSLLKYFRSLVVPDNRWLSTKQLFTQKTFVNNLRELLAFEKKKSVRSIFFLMSADRSSSSRYGNRYSIYDPRFNEVLADLQASGSEIGLHSSYYARYSNTYLNEVRTLEKAIGKKVRCNRYHYLNFDPLHSWQQLSAASITYDFSVGHIYKWGFRAHTARAYKVIDPTVMKVTGITEIPQVFMDIHSMFKDNHAQTLEVFEEIILKTKKCNGSVSLLFHPENMLIDESLWKLYDAMIDICLAQGATVTPELN